MSDSVWSHRWHPPGSPVPGILQARTLEWVAISFSNAWKWKVKVKSLSHVQFSDPMDYSPPGSSIHGIFQARVLEWGAIIQCNPYQAINGIYHRTRTNNFTICMEIQKTSNSQSNLEKEEWKWRNQPAWLQTLLQSHIHQDSMVLAQRQKYRSMEQNRKSIDKSMDTVSLTKEARIYNREKTISLTSGAGKTGQPLVKECN